MKPVIALNMDIAVGPPEKLTIYKTYVSSIVDAGGIPILLPPLNKHDIMQVLLDVKGIVLIGGDDYSPSLYGEEAAPTTQIMPSEREQFDLALMEYIKSRPSMPVLGICGGIQLMNVAFGGSLIQDIESEKLDVDVKHRGDAGWKAKDWHEVQLEEGSRLHKIYGSSRINVPTAHRQAVRKLGDGLKAVGTTDDGVIEAIEAPDHHFTIGVQWHPERDFRGNANLFEEFVKMAK